MSDQISRLGFVWPGGGAEQDFYGFLEHAADHVRLYVSCTRVGGTGDNDHDIEALERTAQLDWLVEAARRLETLNMDCVYWPCTSGSFVMGSHHAKQQVEILKKTLGVPAGSTSLAFIEALQRCGYRKVSVLSTYPEPASRAFVSFLNEFGVEVLSMKWLGAPAGWDAALFTPEFIIENIPDAMHTDAEVLLIPDTAMPSLFAIERFESSAGLPVFTANGVTMWNAIELIDGECVIDGFGSLFAGRLC